MTSFIKSLMPSWASTQLAFVQRVWSHLKFREKAWITCAVGGISGMFVFGGATMTLTIGAAVATTGGLAWLVGYSEWGVAFIARHRVWFDWGISFPCLFAPLTPGIGVSIGLLIVFANALITSLLIWLSGVHRATGCYEARPVKDVLKEQFDKVKDALGRGPKAVPMAA